MNVPQITEAPSVARAKLREYRKALHVHADREYQQLVDAYAQVAKGRALIRLSEAFATAPLDEKGRVKLALAPALVPQIRLSTWSAGAWRLTTLNGSGAYSRWEQSVTDARCSGAGRDGYTLVPIVPPDVRKGTDLARCCILWEVEAWADAAIRATPNIDPLLVRRIGVDLYAVLGEWEATPLERAIAAGRRLA
jgi:hypothetical protein